MQNPHLKIYLRDRIALGLLRAVINVVPTKTYRAYLNLTLDLGMREVNKKTQSWANEDNEKEKST